MHRGIAVAQLRQFGLALAAVVCSAALRGQWAQPQLPALSTGFEASLSGLADTGLLTSAAPTVIEPVSAQLAPQDTVAVVYTPPPPEEVAHPFENPVDRFFRTGILKSTERGRSTLKVTVGSCEGGQLLNLRSIW